MMPPINFLLSLCSAVVMACCIYATLSQTAANDARLGLQTTTTNNAVDDNPRIPPFSSVINPLALLYQQSMPVRAYNTRPTTTTASTKTTSLREEEDPSSSSSSTTTSSIPPIHVLVCVESLCIDSQRFFHDELMTTVNALPHDVVNWKVVPFGNAQLPSNKTHTPTCQHGAAECDVNTYQQCAIHLYPNPIDHLPYLACLFESLPMGHRDDLFNQSTALEPCAHQHHLNFAKLKSCHDDPMLQWKLNMQAFHATPRQHTHVPWVEINGMHREDIDEQASSLLQTICNIYQQQGGHTAGCSSSSQFLEEEEES